MESFELTLDARPESLGVVRYVLDAIPSVWPVGPEAFDDVLVAVNEACANVVSHAYPLLNEGLMEVRAEIDGSSLRIAVRDHGDGFEASETEDFAVGLALIEALTEKLEIERRPDGTHEVRMTFGAVS